MTKKIEEQSRRQIAEFLPDALEKAIGSYRKFMEADLTNPKEFKAHHDACKVAIAHIELLIELARWADLSEADNTHTELGHMLAAAAQEIALHKEQE